MGEQNDPLYTLSVCVCNRDLVSFDIILLTHFVKGFFEIKGLLGVYIWSVPFSFRISNMRDKHVKKRTIHICKYLYYELHVKHVKQHEFWLG